jgi:Aldo/keto reductase family
MRYRNLGRTGIKVSPYALDALMFATQVGNPDPGDSIRIIHRALDAGINLVDTADAYGDSEEVVGRALRAAVTTWSSPRRSAAPWAATRTSRVPPGGGSPATGTTAEPVFSRPRRPGPQASHRSRQVAGSRQRHQRRLAQIQVL